MLVLRALGLGDLLTAVPALRGFRRAMPDSEVVLAAPAVLAPLVELAGAADRVLDHHGLVPLTWPDEPPRMAVNLHGRGSQSHELLRRTSPGRLVAFGCAEARHEGLSWDPDEHEVTRWCRLLTEELGAPCDPRDLRLDPPLRPTGLARPWAVVHPGAAHRSRRWPVERFAEVSRDLGARGLDVVLTGGPGEVEVCDRLASRAGVPRERVLAGRTDVAGLAAVVAHADLVVCGDTGVAHLATAFATPSVVLFGPVAPTRWGPPPDGPHEVIWHGEGDGDPWAEEVDPALLRVEVAEVLERVDLLLERGLRHRRRSRTTPGCA